MVGFAGRESDNIINHRRVIFFVAFACDIPQMGRAGDIVHFEQRMIGAEHWLLVINVDRRSARSARFQRLFQRALRDQPRAARIYQQGRRLHAPEIVARNDTARLLVER